MGPPLDVAFDTLLELDVRPQKWASRSISGVGVESLKPGDKEEEAGLCLTLGGEGAAVWCS